MRTPAATGEGYKEERIPEARTMLGTDELRCCQCNAGVSPVTWQVLIERDELTRDRSSLSLHNPLGGRGFPFPDHQSVICTKDESAPTQTPQLLPHRANTNCRPGSSARRAAVASPQQRWLLSS